MGENRTPDWDSALHRARTHAPFLARALERMPDLAALLAAGEGAAALAGLRTQEVDGPSLLENLRKGLLPSGISWAEPSYSVP